MTMSCVDCGNEVATQYRFCPACGSRKLQPFGVRPPPAVSQQTPPAPEGAQTWHAATAAASPAVPTGAGHQAAIGLDAYGGFFRRLAAYAIDLFLLAVVFFVIGIVIGVGAPDSDPRQIEAAFNALGLLVFWVYCANSESGPRQATLGKRALGLKVCDANGQRLSFGRATGRFFGKLISAMFFGLGFLMIGFTNKRQGLHDKMADTVVVRSLE